jgi:hypothetical protein
MHDPSMAECGMLRVIAQAAVIEAGRRGVAHAEFQSYRIDARRGVLVKGRRVAPVELVVRFEGQVVEWEMGEVRQGH